MWPPFWNPKYATVGHQGGHGLLAYNVATCLKRVQWFQSPLKCTNWSKSEVMCFTDAGASTATPASYYFPWCCFPLIKSGLIYQCSNCQRGRWGLSKVFHQLSLYFPWNSGLTHYFRENWGKVEVGVNPQPSSIRTLSYTLVMSGTIKLSTSLQ